MSLDTVHPELEAEQAYVDRAYDCIRLMLSEVSELRFRGRNDFEKAAFEHWQRTRVAALSDTTSALVFGRIDTHELETFYIGRHHVRDVGYETVVVDWRAPVARTFYQASIGDPMGIRRRRQFLIDGREILGISDDELSEAGALRSVEILHHELDRQRGGQMRDIVATIQAEQDVIIRAPLAGVVVVQGGPGTGKTAIGLHRAAYLLYEHRRRLERLGVLVAGPNPVFIQYVSQVLPSLGESAVTQLAVDDLAPGRTAGVEEAAVARLKGEARMADVLRRALGGRRRALDGDVALSVRGVRFTLPAHLVEREVTTLRERGVAYREGREILRDRLLVHAHRCYEAVMPEGSSVESFAAVTSAVRADASFRAALDRVWPAMTPARLVGDLFAGPQRLAAASEGVLSAGGRKLLRRPRASAEVWTSADRALLDEARALIEGPPDRYGHVVVDEAQDLSPMQLRMLARRTPEGSMTVLGDLGQATGVWAHDDWDEVLEHLPNAAGARVDELTLGYRVSAAIMDVASAILREAAPRLTPPTAVRREAGDVSFVSSEEAARASDVVRASSGMLDRLGSCAVIVPASILDETRHALRSAGLPLGEADHRDLTHPVTLVPVARCKGLEFEGVVVVEPAFVVEEAGLRMLYVAVTRAMRSLAVVHAEPLPDALRAVGSPATLRAG